MTKPKQRYKIELDSKTEYEFYLYVIPKLFPSINEFIRTINEITFIQWFDNSQKAHIKVSPLYDRADIIAEIEAALEPIPKALYDEE